jgi:putative transposase
MAPIHIQLASSTLRKVIKRLHYPLEIMLLCVRWYAAYPLSLRNLEEMMPERGVIVEHATVHRWALKMLPVLAAVFRRRKRPVSSSWRVDETYIKVRGQWKYLYRAVDALGQTGVGVDPVSRTPYGSYRRSPKCPNRTPPSSRIRRNFVSR